MGVLSIINREIGMLLLGIIASVLIAKLSYFILNKYIKGITKKTATDIDDQFIEAFERPFLILVFLIGIYFSLKQVEFMRYYIAVINDIFFVVGVIWSIFTLHLFIKIGMKKWISTDPEFRSMPKLLVKAVNVFAYFIGFMIILKYFQVEITPLIATLGIGGIAIGFALQDTLSNFFAGLHIISDKPIHIGDFIELENNISGYVEDIGWRTTRIRTLPNTLVIIPNSKIATSIITNDSLPVPEMSIVIQCGISYNSDLDKVERVTVDVAKKIQHTVAGAVKNFEPFIRYHTFGDSNINFSIILRVENFVHRYLVTHEFIKMLKRAYDKNSIEISWPVRKIVNGKN